MNKPCKSVCRHCGEVIHLTHWNPPHLPMYVGSGLVFPQYCRQSSKAISLLGLGINYCEGGGHRHEPTWWVRDLSRRRALAIPDTWSPRWPSNGSNG